MYLQPKKSLEYALTNFQLCQPNSLVTKQRKWLYYLQFGTEGQPELGPPADYISKNKIRDKVSVAHTMEKQVLLRPAVSPCHCDCI
jgi:hypothetical protein